MTDYLDLAINREVANWPKNDRRLIGVDGAAPSTMCGWCADILHLRQLNEASRITVFKRTEGPCSYCGLTS